MTLKYETLFQQSSSRDAVINTETSVDLGF